MHSLAETVLHYRIYVMDIEGHITDVHLIQALGDAAALRAAIGLKLDRRIEVWCGDRQVLQLAPSRSSHHQERLSPVRPASDPFQMLAA